MKGHDSCNIISITYFNPTVLCWSKKDWLWLPWFI